MYSKKGKTNSYTYKRRTILKDGKNAKCSTNKVENLHKNYMKEMLSISNDIDKKGNSILKSFLSIHKEEKENLYVRSNNKRYISPFKKLKNGKDLYVGVFQNINIIRNL